ncbi:hypothetical protein Slin15195_G066760 [Septoria linicola]|uniref:Uncharacterized protein n=1 Tax=Septoria linicola TaxID=215465 RepID=A0A9Q9EKJ6_9PEZI|nr:hypothetical protein Slin15195_G066760 [Septoria linicola]
MQASDLLLERLLSPSDFIPWRFFRLSVFWHDLLDYGPNGSRVNCNFVEDDHVDLTSDAVRRQLAGLLERFYNAFSSLHPIPSNTGLHTEIIDMALARVDIQSRAIAAPSWVATKGLQILIPFVDEDTGEKDFYEFTAAVGYTLRSGLPALPPNAQLYVKEQRRATRDLVQQGPGLWETVVPADVLAGTASETSLPKHLTRDMDPRKLLDTEKVMRVCSWKMSNLRSTQKKMKIIRNHLVHTYTVAVEGGKSKSAFTGLFNVYRDTDKGVIIIGAGAGMIKGLGLDMSSASANSFKIPHLQS